MLGGGRSRWGIAAVAALALGAGAQAAQATTWSVDNPSVNEGNGTTQLTFTITATNLPGLYASDSIGFQTVDGTATAPSDYSSTSGRATVAGGLVPGASRTYTVSVVVNGDTLAEPDETLRLVLDDGTTGTGTIRNDDLPHIRVSDPSVSERDGSATFTVSLDGPGNVSVHYATADGSATAGQDYQATGGSLSFTGGQTSKQVAVPILDDTIHEDTESFAMNLSSVSGAASSANKLTGTATIADDDAPPPPPPGSTGGGSPTGATTLAATSGSSLTDMTNPQAALSRPRSRRGTIIVAIGCPAGELLCRGTLTTFAEPTRGTNVRWLRREHRLGSATFVIAGGKQALITTRVSRRALGQLRRARGVQIRSYAVVRDAAGNIGTASAGARLARVR